MIKIFPNYVLVEPETMEGKQTSGGIYIPDATKEVLNTGILIDGGEVLQVEKGVKVKIWYRMWAGEDIETEGKKLKIIHKQDLLAYEEVK